MNDADRRPDDRRSISPKLVLRIAAIALLVWFWAANRREVRVTFWIITTEVRLWVALLVASVIGAIGGYSFARRGRD
jgi:hypothetical protein